jgi:hypothetical protein
MTKLIMYIYTSLKRFLRRLRWAFLPRLYPIMLNCHSKGGEWVIELSSYYLLNPPPAKYIREIDTL